MDQIISALQAAASRISADFTAAKQQVAALTAQVADLQAQLAAAHANAVSDAQRAALQAVADQLNAADPVPVTPAA